MISTALEKNVVVFFFDLPRSLGKSAHMLVLKYMRDLGWNPTVITIETADADERRPAILDWNGVEVHSIVPVGNTATRISNRLYRMRSNWAVGNNAAVSGSSNSNSKKKSGVSRTLANLPMYAMRPVSAAMSFPDKYRYYGASEALELAHKLHHQKDFQAVISLYGPFTPHMVARRFANEQSVPWVALQKDYYSQPDTMTSSFAGRAANGLKRRLERRTIGHCDALLPVNENMVTYYQGLSPKANITPLTHCFDEDDFTGLEQDEALDADVFRVLSLGFVHKLDHYGLGVFFEALGELLEESAIDSKDFRARFVGHGGEIARSYARLHNCEAILETVPPVAHDEAMRELRRAGCLFFQQVHLGGRRRLPEFLASKKPILAFPEDPGAMSDRVIREYGAAAIANSKDEIKKILLDWYRAFKERGNLQIPVNEEVVNSFGARRKALELGNILRTVTGMVTDPTLAELTIE